MDAEGSSVVEGLRSCATCGYSLMGLPESGHCPECGRPFDSLVRNEVLRYADADWLERLIGGVTLMLVSIKINLLTIVLMWLCWGIPLVWGTCGVCSSLVYLAGVAMLTSEEPGCGRDSRCRRNTRLATLVTAVFSLFACLLVTVLPQALTIVFSMLGIVSLAAFFYMFDYLAQLAARLPDATLQRMTRTLMWWFIAMYICLLVGCAVAISGYNSGSTLLAKLGFISTAGAFAGIVMFSISIILLLRVYRSQFLLAHRQSRQHQEQMLRITRPKGSNL